ncbi:MAG: DUF3575 domain-containing protein [Flavobacteriia bacterium]|nr:DUF3575 domain-containing protein [Flavobacteriia bacterium]
MRKLLLSTLILGCGALHAQLASSDTIEYPNVVRWNLTPFLISGSQSIVLGYERVISEDQSFSVNAGHLQFPIDINWSDSTTDYGGTERNTGFSIAADYRFYFRNRNADPAPSGVYWAPFFTCYYFDQRHRFNYYENGSAEDVVVNNNIYAIAAGVELGYQFTLGKRWTIDLIFIGPAYGFYGIKGEVDGTFPTSVTEREIYQRTRDLLIDSYPDIVSSFEKGEFSTSGFGGTWGFNFRYVLQVGYRF